MTELRQAERILQLGHCSNLDCSSCPAEMPWLECKAGKSRLGHWAPTIGHGGLSTEAQQWFENWVRNAITEENQSMEPNHTPTNSNDDAPFDRSAALRRIKTLKGELEKLQKIVERPRLVYDANKVYIGMMRGRPYILVRNAKCDAYSFQCPQGSVEQGWSYSQETGQACLDKHLAAGFQITAFSDAKKAFQFFTDQL